MMKFHIQRNDKTLWIRVENRDNAMLDFRREMSTEFEAQVICQEISRQMGLRISEIKRVAYESGWKDAKMKTKKKETFYTCLNSFEVGW